MLSTCLESFTVAPTKTTTVRTELLKRTISVFGPLVSPIGNVLEMWILGFARVLKSSNRKKQSGRTLNDTAGLGGKKASEPG